MQWTNALSTSPSLEAAITEVVEKITQSMPDVEPDLGILFISSAYATDYSRLAPLLLEKLPISTLIGCSGGGIVGMDGDRLPCEVEGEPALSLTVAKLPGITIQPFYVTGEELPDLDSSPQAWSKILDIDPQTKPDFILLSDPFFIPHQ